MSIYELEVGVGGNGSIWLETGGIDLNPTTFFFFLIFRATPAAMEVPRLGFESELQLPAYATALATQDPRRICNLHHRSQQHWILNPLGKARDQTTSSWIQSGSLTPEPRRECLIYIFYQFMKFNICVHIKFTALNTKE